MNLLHTFSKRNYTKEGKCVLLLIVSLSLSLSTNPEPIYWKEEYLLDFQSHFIESKLSLKITE